MKNLYRLLLISVVSVVITACGGGGSDSDGGSGSNINTFNGRTSAGTVSTANQDDITTAAAEGLKRSRSSANADNAIDLGAFSVVAPNRGQQIIIDRALSRLLADVNTKQVSGVQRKVSETIDCDFSGTSFIDFPGISSSATTLPQNGSGTVTFNNCSDFPGELLNGTIEFSWTGYSDGAGFTSYTSTFDVEYTADGVTETYVGTATCTNFSCDFSDDYSVGGVEYRLEDVQVTEVSSGVYDVSFRVYHEDHGYVDVVADDITFDDATGNICSGTVTISDSGGDALFVDFGDSSSCTDFTVTEL